MNDNNKVIAELTAFFAISRELASSPDLDQALKRILEIMEEQLGFHRSSILLIEGGSDELRTEIAHGLSEEEIKKGRFKEGEGITGSVLKTGKPIVVPDISKEPRFLNRTGSRSERKSQERLAFLAVPLTFQSRMVGVLSTDCSISPEGGDLDEDLRVLTTISSIIAQAVVLRKQFMEERKTLEERALRLEHHLKDRYAIEGWIGHSRIMKQIAESIHLVAKSRATVLVMGESGTGKEVVAKAIHFNSPRNRKPFVQINCAAIPESLLESELFGHEKGAFTGAHISRPGKFEQANEGTIFLDEVGEISPVVQVKLLRVLQERVVERVGGARTIPVDVRIIAATNRNLEEAIRKNAFREDLYYRLNVVPIFLPPLRQRKEDIPLLIEHFLGRFNLENGRSVRISPGAVLALLEHDWPGNVRELENTVERLVVMSQSDMIEETDVSRTLALFSSFTPPLSQDPSRDSLRPVDRISIASGRGEGLLLPEAVSELERKKILDVLERTGWIKTRAAALLGITPRQLGYRMMKYAIDPSPPYMKEMRSPKVPDL
ncbi:MAG: nif-specific transcriptional activator NifA [Leptospirillum sp.]